MGNLPRHSGLLRKHRNAKLPTLLLDKGVPPTNQTIIYYTGDDGTYQTGVEFATPRFKDNNDGTITDLATGLMWVKDPSQIGGVWGTPGSPSAMSLDDALSNCNNLDYAGHTDWRLPNIQELESIVDYSKVNPSIDEEKFPNTEKGAYWASSVCQYGCENTWWVGFDYQGKEWDQDRDLEKHVRPVRKVPTGRRLPGRKHGFSP